MVPLAPRTLDLLLVFVSSGGRLLTKDELLRVVWSDVHVEEASLTFQVSTLRKALGEQGSAWIETVPKHGYRFTAPVTEDVQGQSRTGAAPGHADTRVARRVLVVIASALVLIVAAGGAAPWLSRTPRVAPMHLLRTPC